MEFKGTKGRIERKYVTGICIGIGTFGDPSIMTANSILPETDKQYKKEKEEIEANMLIYSKAPEMLAELHETLIDLKIIRNQIAESNKVDHRWDGMVDMVDKWINRKEELIREATTI